MKSAWELECIGYSIKPLSLWERGWGEGLDTVAILNLEIQDGASNTYPHPQILSEGRVTLEQPFAIGRVATEQPFAIGEEVSSYASASFCLLLKSPRPPPPADANKNNETDCLPPTAWSTPYDRSRTCLAPFRRFHRRGRCLLSHRPRRDRRPAGPQRRRQDHVDEDDHRLPGTLFRKHPY